jgi:hypothetical protein
MGLAIKGEGEYPVKHKNKSFFMQKVLVWPHVFLYALGMSNTATQYQFAIYNGETVLILEQFGMNAWVSFNEGEEMEVSMFDLCLI